MDVTTGSLPLLQRSRYSRRIRRAWLRTGVVSVVAAMALGPSVVTAPGAVAAGCRAEQTGRPLREAARAHPFIERLALRQSWDLATGDRVTVGVVDSGVDADHPDLRGAVARGSEFTVVATKREYARTTPFPQTDCEAHGTAVAGVVAARRAEGDRMAGVAPGATVYPVRIADGVDRATPRTLAAAIDDAVTAGADVLNLSFARPVDDAPVRAAVRRAVEAGVLVVAAAGNEGNGGAAGGRMFPAAYDGVLAVAAVAADGQPLESSNSGPWVDLSAYGDQIPVVAPNGSGYLTGAGTSIATAQVSGAAALVRARFPELTAEEVAHRLTASATPLGGGRNDRTGAGLVDPFGALTHLGGPDGADSGANGGRDVPAGHVPVQAVPRNEPLLSAPAATALAWSGGALLVVVLVLLAAPAVRRAVGRGWRAGPVPDRREGSAPAPGAAAARPAAGLHRLGGAPATTHARHPGGTP
ncbi:S8 family serine peptidase [Streptomyces sp. MAR4 CNY-716]